MKKIWKHLGFVSLFCDPPLCFPFSVWRADLFIWMNVSYCPWHFYKLPNLCVFKVSVAPINLKLKKIFRPWGIFLYLPSERQKVCWTRMLLEQIINLMILSFTRPFVKPMKINQGKKRYLLLFRNAGYFFLHFYSNYFVLFFVSTPVLMCRKHWIIADKTSWKVNYIVTTCHRSVWAHYI